ncbi:MAG: polyamine aminopropyltransferase [Candidatus Cloacimonas sp.]|jgi:spermidine synthase|nr:polyamine aminopropyltransferase [Candidatus Cloacimonas sp.]
MTEWHIDYHSPHRGLTFAISEHLYHEQSQYQRLDIVETPEFGKVMLLDGVLMLTEKDEFVYHEMLCHPALITHPAPQNVLIIGGGDCGTLSRVLQHPSVHRVVQVEIDEMVTKVSRTYFPKLTAATADPRAELIFDDGIAYLKQQSGAFDVILVDSTDPVGPAEGLFMREFFADCHRALTASGILCLQSESPWIDALQPVIYQVNQDLQALFPQVFPYTAAIQTYQAGLWMFQMACKQGNPLLADAAGQITERTLSCSYYNAAIHHAAFALPEFVNNLLAFGGVQTRQHTGKQ